MAEYDFASGVREELEHLRRELAAPDMAESVRELAARFGADEQHMLAALWRASKRRGESLTVFAGELRAQFQRETAAASGSVIPATAPAH